VLFVDTFRSPYFMDAALILSLLTFLGTRSRRLITMASGISSSGAAADALVILSVSCDNARVYGMICMPDIYTTLHAASIAVFRGMISLLAVSAVTGSWRSSWVVLISAFPLLITPSPATSSRAA
jgi:hypothetical protein